jgi:hypothetical protein
MSSVTYPIDVETPILVCDGLRTNTVDCNQLNFNRLAFVDRTVTYQCLTSAGALVGPTTTGQVRFYFAGDLVFAYVLENKTLIAGQTVRSIGFSLPADVGTIPSNGFTQGTCLLLTNISPTVAMGGYQCFNYGSTTGSRIDVELLPQGQATNTMTMSQGTMIPFRKI